MDENLSNIITISGLIISIIGTIVSFIGLYVSIKSIHTAKNVSDAIAETQDKFITAYRLSNFKSQIDTIIKDLKIYVDNMNIEKVKIILTRVSANCERIKNNDSINICQKKVKSFNKISNEQKNKQGEIVKISPLQMDTSAKMLLSEIIVALENIKNEI